MSDLLRELKKASSYWIKTKDAKFKSFQWQAGFGAFSIGHSQVETVKQYIAKQKEHHKTELFEDEYRKFLQKYEIDKDEVRVMLKARKQMPNSKFYFRKIGFEFAHKIGSSWLKKQA